MLAEVPAPNAVGVRLEGGPDHPGADLGKTPYIECRQEARTLDLLVAS